MFVVCHRAAIVWIDAGVIDVVMMVSIRGCHAVLLLFGYSVRYAVYDMLHSTQETYSRLALLVSPCIPHTCMAFRGNQLSTDMFSHVHACLTNSLQQWGFFWGLLTAYFECFVPAP